MNRYKNFRDFYPYYISQHQKLGTRIFHLVAKLSIFCTIAYVITTGKERFLWYIPILGYGLSGLSHFIFEKNKSVIFQYPLLSFLADFRMFFDILQGKIKLTNQTNHQA